MLELPLSPVGPRASTTPADMIKQHMLVREGSKTGKEGTQAGTHNFPKNEKVVHKYITSVNQSRFFELYSAVYKIALSQIIKKLTFCPITKFPNLPLHLPLSVMDCQSWTLADARATTGPCRLADLSLCFWSSIIHRLNDYLVSPISSHQPKQQSDHNLYTTYKSWYHSHSCPLQSQTFTSVCIVL